MASASCVARNKTIQKATLAKQRIVVLGATIAFCSRDQMALMPTASNQDMFTAAFEWSGGPFRSGW